MDRREMLKFFLKLGREAKKITDEGEGKEKHGRNYFGGTSIKMDLDLEGMVKREIRGLDFGLITEEKPVKPKKSFSGTIILDPLDGSKNYERGFPAYSFAIAGANKPRPALDDLEAAAVVDLCNGNEYCAVAGKGFYKNGKRMRPAKPDSVSRSVPLISGDFGKGPRLSARLFSKLADFAYMRMLGASTLDMANAAQGAIDAYVDVRGKLLVTHAAGIMLMKEAGLKVTDKNGQRITQALKQDTKFTLIAANDASLHRKILELCGSLWPHEAPGAISL